MISRYRNLNKYRELMQAKEFYLLAAGIIFILISYILNSVFLADLSALVAVILLGGPIVRGAVQGLIKRELNVDELVSIALIASLAIGEYRSAALISLIMAAGSLIEEFTAQKARSAIGKLMQLNPERAAVVREGVEVDIPVGEIVKGDRVIVRSGDKIPVDGKIVRGVASVNQASLTGESMPVEKNIGDPGFAGTTVYSGMLELEAEETGGETVLGKLIQLVREAENQGSPLFRVADRYAGWFTPVVLLISLGVYLFTRDLHRSITVLIVGCPCAFILASPTAVVSAIGNASRNGILVKGGAILEEISRIKAVVFDKTGTLTRGEPQVVKIAVRGEHTVDSVLSMAAAAEGHSRHPLARAISEEAKERGLAGEEMETYRNIPGLGIEALAGGKKIFVGTLLPEEAKLFPGFQGGGEGEKALAVKLNDQIIGAILIRDRIRPDAYRLVDSLQEQGIEKIQILTGDNLSTAAHIAGEIGIEEYYCDLLPEEKLGYIERLQRDGYKVAMVGDGINDAPSLASADIGIAMGAMGTDVAMEASDVTLMSSNLSRIPYLLKLSKATIRTINLNIIFAVAFNVVALIISSYGGMNPIQGAILHNIGSIFVVINSARLLGLNPSDRVAGGSPVQFRSKYCSGRP
ncbi:MAG: cadmium-translocating P-type ATPase [Firmicutes bacterium]|nr:cadmium-translocating P-type ATPase [Bacillota bacterium]